MLLRAPVGVSALSIVTEPELLLLLQLAWANELLEVHLQGACKQLHSLSTAANGDSNSQDLKLQVCLNPFALVGSMSHAAQPGEKPMPLRIIITDSLCSHPPYYSHA